MTLCKTATPITDIRGGMGGVYFTRDRTGLHCTAKPRRVKTSTSRQNAQRKAFIKARSFSHDNREVSYNIYRALNGLEPCKVPNDYYPDMK